METGSRKSELMDSEPIDDRYNVEVKYGDPKDATVLENPCLKEKDGR